MQIYNNKDYICIIVANMYETSKNNDKNYCQNSIN